MISRLSTTVICAQLFTTLLCSAQMNSYRYKRELKGIDNQWHAVQLPNDVFGKINKAFSDLRIYGITPANDTIEAPYLLNIKQEKTKTTSLAPTLLNQVNKGNTYYFTFEIPKGEKLNQLELNFAQNNFDWRINLEGSDDGKTWFNVRESYRIVSIRNGFTNYTFSTLHFPTLQYQYLRLHFSSNVKPELQSAEIKDKQSTPGIYTTYQKWFSQTTEDKKNRLTNIHISLAQPVPVSVIRFYINNPQDYYRPVTVSSLSDSTKTPKGWLYNYETLYTGTLSSLEENIFQLGNNITRQLKIEISNHDNQPLQIDSVSILGNIHELAVRFDADAKYYLVYSNRNASVPQYDIINFKERIPADLSLLQLGEEEKIISKSTSEKVSPIIENKLWLWAIMGAIILLLGWFTLNMIRTKNSTEQ